MKLKLFLILLLLVGLSVIGYPENQQEDDNSEVIPGPGMFVLDPFLMEKLPGTYFFPFVLENYMPDVTFLTEENDGFSLIDNPRVYFEGDSFINFNWYYNGVNINSALNDGTPGVILPFSMVDSYRLQGESPINSQKGMNFITSYSDKSYSQLRASSVYSDLGTYWFTFMIQPDHPSTRADRLYTNRRKIDSNYFLDYRLNKNFKKSQLMLGLSYFDIQRQFNDFNIFNSTYNEDGRLFSVNTRFRKNLSHGNFELFGVFNYLDRSNLLSELGVYPQETIGKERLSFLAGMSLKKDRFDLGLTILFEQEDLTPYVENYSKELLDNDGDGIYPYGDSGESKIGKFTSGTIDLNLKYRLLGEEPSDTFQVDAFANARFSNLKGEEKYHQYNAMFFDSNPYQVVLWNKGADYTNTNTNARFGLNLNMDISKQIALIARLFVEYNALSFDNSMNNLEFFSPAFDIGIELFKTRRTSLLFSYGILPYDIRENVNFFLETNRPSGTIYSWNDKNGDAVYQQGEESSVFGYTGGQYHHVDENISAPLKERLLLQFKTPLSRYWTLNVKAIYKRIKNRFRVKFDQDYGFYETYQNKELYFFTQPFTDYYLTNSGYEKDPFYAQLYFDISGRREKKWFFYFSFMAHMGMGDTSFGNGPGSNDIGLLDESQANPNSWINGFGRVDGDRGFVSKSYFGYYLAKKLFLAVSLKYRDGNPFAFFNTFSNYNQTIIYYDTIKAENEKGEKGGPREDYVADISMQFSYNFRLLNGEAVASLSFFNIFDFGAELSEYVFSGGTRDAVELQIPRSIRFTLTWKF